VSDRDNMRHAHRHAVHAFEDFAALRLTGELAHSLSHHLRHAVYRLGLELPEAERIYVERDARP
jgi:hypothetical protein